MKTYVLLSVWIIISASSFAQDNWEELHTEITEHLHDIEFIDDSVGFVYSYGTGKIYKTTNCGYNWTVVHQTDSLYLEQIQFVDPNHGWICGEKGTILRTLDGGRSWHDISISSDCENLLLYGMYFINESVGYVSGAEMMQNQMLPIAYKTNNGGTSWEEAFRDIPHMILNLEQFGEDLFASGNGFVLRMDIQDQSWEYVFKDTLREVGQIRDLAFADDTLGLGVSFKGKLLTSKDGGNSFTQKTITGNRLRSIAFSKDKTWVAAGDNTTNDKVVLLTSDDHGVSWRKLGGLPDIHRIFISAENIWIVGKHGLIAKRNR